MLQEVEVDVLAEAFQELEMSSFQIKIKPTSGGANITVETSSEKSIAELKEAVASEAGIAAGEQRLIYKGQVLKNERTVESYGRPCIVAYNEVFKSTSSANIREAEARLAIPGIQADHVVHMVKSKPPPTSQR